MRWWACTWPAAPGRWRRRRRAATEAFVRLPARLCRTPRAIPRDDLITHLIAAEEEGERLSTDELITTCILLLNAGHEATVHTIGNGVKTLLETGTPAGRWRDRRGRHGRGNPALRSGAAHVHPLGL
jgi:cytochrome P450